MNVYVYDKLSSKPIREVLAGVSAAGDTPRQCNPNVWDGEMRDDADVVVVNGMGSIMSPVFRAYRQRGVPVVIVENGHVHRGQYWQLGVGRLNWMPPHPCPDDRRIALGLKQTPRESGNPDGPILFLGQKAGDAQTFNLDLYRWTARVMARLRDYTQRAFVFRPHPLDKTGVVPWGEHRFAVQEPEEVPLDDAFAQAHSVVTFNSNGGLKAINAGLPVFCDPRAIYADAANTDMDAIEGDHRIDPEAWRQTMNRIAYSQWNFEEIADGSAWKYIKGHLGENASGISKERTRSAS